MLVLKSCHAQLIKSINHEATIIPMNGNGPKTLYPIFYSNSLLMKVTICLLNWGHFCARIKGSGKNFPSPASLIYIHGVGDTVGLGRLGTWSYQQNHILGLCEKMGLLYRYGGHFGLLMSRLCP